MSSRPPIFRDQAVEYYLQSREKTILPRLAKPPIFLLLWILLSLAGIALLVAWLGQVPVYISGSGIVIEHTMLQNSQPVHTASALVFVPVAPAHTLQIHIGTPVQLQIGTQGQPFTTVVAQVEPGILSPDEIQRHYAPGGRVLSMITGPSMVVSVALGSAFAAPAYGGSLLQAQVQVGSTSVLSSLFGPA